MWVRRVAAEVIHFAADQGIARSEALWLKCPHCGEPNIRMSDGRMYPPSIGVSLVNGLPPDVENAWRDARTDHATAAYTASEMMCRKILMHLAVNVAKSPAGLPFVQYVQDLEDKGYILPGLRTRVDAIRDRGNAANRELPASTEPQSCETLQVTEFLLKGAYELGAGATP